MKEIKVTKVIKKTQTRYYTWDWFHECLTNPSSFPERDLGISILRGILNTHFKEIFAAYAIRPNCITGYEVGFEDEEIPTFSKLILYVDGQTLDHIKTMEPIGREYLNEKLLVSRAEVLMMIHKAHQKTPFEIEI